LLVGQFDGANASLTITHVDKVTNTDGVDDFFVASKDLVASAHGAGLTGGVLSQLTPEGAVAPVSTEGVGDDLGGVNLGVIGGIVEGATTTGGASDESTAVLAGNVVVGGRVIDVINDDGAEEGSRAEVIGRANGAVELDFHSLAHPVFTASDANTVDDGIRAVLEDTSGRIAEERERKAQGEQRGKGKLTETPAPRRN